jgi:hypothetical protein
MKINYFICLLFVSLLSACDTSLDVKDPNFDVTTEKTTYKVGENVFFNISGDPRYITFYSGEDGSNRDFIGAPRFVAYDKLNLYFTLYYQYPKTEDQLSVWVSTNFTGDRSSYADVQKATWINVTDRFPLIKNRTATAAATASNKADLSDIVKPGDKLNFAFRYTTQPATSTNFATVWLSKVNLSYSKGFNEVVISGEANKNLNTLFPEFPAVNENKNPARSENRGFRVPYVDNLILWGNTNVAPYTTNAYQEEWWVSTPFDITSSFEIKDVGVPLKGYSDSRVEYYTWTYSKPGTYKVVFEGANASLKETVTKTKEIYLTITE